MIAGPHQWSLSQVSRLLTVARLLFTTDSGIYLKNSKALGLFRENPAMASLDKYRRKILAFFDSSEYLSELLHFCHTIGSSSAVKHADNLATSALAKLMLKIEDAEKAKIWGWLIKESFNQGHILDISNPTVEKYWKVFCNKLKKIVKAKEFDSAEIARCVFTFIEKLKEIKAGKSAEAFESYIHLARIIMYHWGQENTNQGVSTSAVLGMLLGPSLFKALRLEDQIFHSKKHKDLSVKLLKELNFSQACMQAILSDPTLGHDLILAEGLIGKLNQLSINAPSDSLQTVHVPSIHINPLFEISVEKVKRRPMTRHNEEETLQVHMNPLFGKVLPDSMRRRQINKS